MEGEGTVWVEEERLAYEVGGGEGGKEYNRSHWNVEMCVCKRPVNSCLKQHNTLAWLGKYSSKIEKKKI